MELSSKVCVAAKAAWLHGTHQPSDEYRIALYSSVARIDQTTTVYTPDGEIESNGYARGGKQLDGFCVSTANDSAFLTWNTPAWDGLSCQVRGALVYNRTKDGAAILAIDFGGTVSPGGSGLSVNFSRLICLA